MPRQLRQDAGPPASDISPLHTETKCDCSLGCNTRSWHTPRTRRDRTFAATTEHREAQRLYVNRSSALSPEFQSVLEGLAGTSPRRSAYLATSQSSVATMVCPMRFILVAVSAFLALAAFAWCQQEEGPRARKVRRFKAPCRWRMSVRGPK